MHLRLRTFLFVAAPNSGHILPDACVRYNLLRHLADLGIAFLLAPRSLEEARQRERKDVRRWLSVAGFIKRNPGFAHSLTPEAQS